MDTLWKFRVLFQADESLECEYQDAARGVVRARFNVGLTACSGVGGLYLWKTPVIGVKQSSNVIHTERDRRKHDWRREGQWEPLRGRV